MYGQFEPFFQSLSDIATNDVLFPTDETEYQVNLANVQGGPGEANRGGSTPQPHTPTPGPGVSAGSGPGQNSQSSIIASLSESREVITDLIIQNGSFEDCNTTALLSFLR